MIKESKGGRGRSRSYGGPEDYKEIRKQIIDKIWKFPKKKSSDILKYAAKRIALFGAGLYDQILEETIKKIEKEFRNRNFDYDVLRDDLVKEWSISRDEAENIIYDAVGPDNLDMGDQPMFASKKNAKYYTKIIHDEIVKSIDPYKESLYTTKPSFYKNLRDRMMNRFQLEENEAQDVISDIVEDKFPELSDNLEWN